MHLTKLLNLTPHVVAIRLLSGDTLTLQPEPQSARLTPHHTPQPALLLDEGPSWTHRIPLAQLDLGVVSGLQYDEKGLIRPCVVSLPVLQYMQQLWASAKRSPYHPKEATMPMLWLSQAPYSRPQATSLDKAVQAWQDGKDFRAVPFGPYCSIRDAEEMKRQGHATISIQFKNEYKELPL